MDMKPFEMLEERIQQAAKKLESLRQENDSLRKKVDSGAGPDTRALRKSNTELKAELKSIRKEKDGELRDLLKERDQVKKQVAQLIDELDSLGLDED